MCVLIVLSNLKDLAGSLRGFFFVRFLCVSYGRKISFFFITMSQDSFSDRFFFSSFSIFSRREDQPFITKQIYATNLLSEIAKYHLRNERIAIFVVSGSSVIHFHD